MKNLYNRRVEKVKIHVTWEVEAFTTPEGKTCYKISGVWYENGERWTTGERCEIVYHERDVKPTLTRLRRNCGDYVWLDVPANVYCADIPPNSYGMVACQ